MRCLDEFRRGHDHSQALYGIVQGGIYPDLRAESVDFNNKQPFFGIAIGGSLGATKADMHSIVSMTARGIRKDVPVHLLGIGGVIDILHGVRQGIDTFDCVHPTRIARHGLALVKASHWTEQRVRGEDIDESLLPLAEKNARRRLKERLEIAEQDRAKAALGATARAPTQVSTQTTYERRRAAVENKAPQPREHIKLGAGHFRYDSRPIDSECQCYTCKNFSRAYLHHLIKNEEHLYTTLVSFITLFITAFCHYCVNLFYL